MRRLALSLGLLSLALLALGCGSDSKKSQPAQDLNTESDVDDTSAVSDLVPDTAPDLSDLQTPDAPPDETPQDLTDLSDTSKPDSVDTSDSNDSVDPDLDQVGPDQTDVVTPGVNWGTCPSYISQSLPGAKCAFVPMPLDYQNPDGATIDVFLFKKAASQDAGKRQLWFLQGGPGGSGADFAAAFASYAKEHPEWDLYSLDHRGVGNSARLTCPQEDDPYSFDYAACAEYLQQQWGELGLQQFSTSQAARDLASAIELVRQPGVPVFVYGASYGTYWALRHLRLYPDQANGTILDSICSPGNCHLDDYDWNFNENGHLLMNACAADPICGSKLATIDPDPWAVVAKVFAKLDDGTLCNGQLGDLDRPTLRMLLGVGEMDGTLRNFIPALLYRLYRCNSNDLDVLNNFFWAIQNMYGGISAASPLPNYEDLDASMTLGTNIINSELLGSRTLTEVQTIVNEAFFSTDASVAMLEVVENHLWPTYPDDGHMNQFGPATQPLLMLNGTLDPQTTLAMARPTGDYYQGANQTFVEVPNCPHGVVFTSFTNDSVDLYLMGSQDYLVTTCGYKMMEAFVTDPSVPVDSSCLEQLHILDFSPDSQLNTMLSSYILGTDDMYDGQYNPMMTMFAAPERPINPLPSLPRRGR